MPLAGDEYDNCLRHKKTKNITRRNYNLYSMYGQYNTIKKGYCAPMAFERMDFNVKFVFNKRSSQCQKLMEIFRDAYGNENPGRTNPKIIVENKREAKQVE